MAVPIRDFDINNGEAVGLNEQDISQEIVKLRPDATPLDTITRNAVKKTQPCVSQEVKYYSQSSKPFVDYLDGNSHGNGSSAASPCCNFMAQGDGALSVFIQVKNPKIWRLKDTLLMRNLDINVDNSGRPFIGGDDTIRYDQMFYVASKTGLVLELVPVGGMKGDGANADSFVVPTFRSTTPLFRMGSAMAEKDMHTEPFGMLPISDVNYCQNFMAQIEESTFEKLTKKEVEVSLSDLEADALYDMRNEIETSYLWGEKYFFDDARDGRTYFTEGITRQIKKVLYYGAGSGDTTLTKIQYIAWLKSLFTGNSGSGERLLFAGSDLIASIELLQLDESDKQHSASKVEETYLGVHCTKITSTFGTLHVVHHPLFDEQGWSQRGLAIDPQFVFKRVFVPMKASALDFKSSGQKNADAKILQEVSCLVLRYPDCHAIIMPKE